MATKALTKPEPNKQEIVLQSKLEVAKAQAEALQVRNSEECAQGKLFLKGIRDVIKQIGFLKDPAIDSARKHLDFLREDKNQWIRLATDAGSIAEQKVNEYTRQERARSEAEARQINEQKRINAARIAEENRKAAIAQAEADRKKREKEIAEARKAGELKAADAKKLQKQAEEGAARAKEEAERQVAIDSQVESVTVKPNIPTVAGTRSMVLWKFRILDANRLPRQYMQPNEVKIGAEVRFIKDKAAAEAKIPGIEVYTEESN
jgi:hypothetical protein